MTTPTQMPESLKVPEELAAIQQALDAGPTPGPWFASNRGSYGVSEDDEGSVSDEYGEDVGAEFVKPIGHLPTIRGELWYRDAAFVAACNPAAMANVLEHISALQAALKDRDAEIERLKKDAERTARNRDMWKGQCERQAEKLTSLRIALLDVVKPDIAYLGADADTGNPDSLYCRVRRARALLEIS